ncbi:MAG: DUF1592 domain-containing protein [Myxococcota bacterium]|nr:DUF1592 domain-containing protein [Myxococcota bacterium]
MTLLLWLACGGPTPQDSAPVSAQVEQLDAPRLLRRASLDLRGKLPSNAELWLVEQDPDAYPELVAEYLEDPAFEDRMVELLQERWWTKVDIFDVPPSDYFLPSSQEFPYAQSVGEEPLRLMAHVIANDRPYTEIVTADYTMANELLAEIWPLEREAGEGWTQATYVDGRPGVGVLSTNGLWWRYTTTDSNMNRSRATAMARLLLCADYLGRPISFSEGEEVVAVEDAVKNDPYCLACHATIDPLAANLFGFWWLSLYSRVEEESYHPERESLAEDFLGVNPAYFGTPIAGLSELGWAMSQDPRFYSCAVDSTAELLWRRPLTAQDRATLEPLRQDFVDQGALLKPLMAELLQAEAYGAAPDSALHNGELRMMPPSMLESALYQVTGFAWTENGYAQLQNDVYGYRILAGGVDGYAVTEPQTRPGLPWALVTKRSAEIAASKTLTQAQDGMGLLGHAPLQEGTASGEFEAVVEETFFRLTAVHLTPSELDSYAGLWDEVNAQDGPEAAWQVLFTVMLRDPRFLTY